MFSPVFAVSLSFGYLAFLFAVAFITDRLRPHFKQRLVSSPLVYTLSISIYCTSWTYYGAVGSAAKNGLEFITIYLGPTLVFLAWWTVLRKMIRIASLQHTTSIADFISARYGKSARLSVLVTLIALTATTPYIALQLQAVATSFEALIRTPTLSTHSSVFFGDIGFWVAVIMAVFVSLYGARLIDAKEQHAGVVAAIAVESVVKLFAFVSIGLLVIFGLKLGLSDRATAPSLAPAALEATSAQVLSLREQGALRWMTMLFLSAAAVLCLPRQFQVTVVENRHERHLATASWLFPTYLFILCLFTVPIAITGLRLLPGSNPDLFVMSVPLAAGFSNWALFAYIGGLASATSMVIMASIAMSIMMSNHLVMPLILRIEALGLSRSSDLTNVQIRVRQINIAVLLLLGFLYYYLSRSNEGLAAMGLIAFAGVAQFFPVLIGGLFWREGTEVGALAGLGAGYLVWLYFLILPTLQDANWALIANLPDPQGLFHAMELDPLVGALFWSLSLNTLLYVAFSFASRANALERLQSAYFVDVFRSSRVGESELYERSATVEDLYELTQRFIGRDQAYRAFRGYAVRQGLRGHLPNPDQNLVPFVERLLAGRIGAASARVMVASIATGETISMDAVIRILDETQQAIEYSHALEQKSAELEAIADQLRDANEQLMALDIMKDDFLSRVSHELRTPMTALRSLTEILTGTDDLSQEEQQRFLKIMAQESKRLTRLLDDILEVSRLESGMGVKLDEAVNPLQVMRDAIAVVEASATTAEVKLLNNLPVRWRLRAMGDGDRLQQVFVNLLSNAIKYNKSPNPFVLVSAERQDGALVLHVQDNGPGISEKDQKTLFTKFSRSWQDVVETTTGSGLGLAISKQIVQQMNGEILVRTRLGEGARFSVKLPVFKAGAADQASAAGSGPASAPGDASAQP